MNGYTEVEASKQPATTPFHRTYVAEDRYALVVSTQPLLRNVPDPGKAPMRAMSLKDLKSSSELHHSLNYLSDRTYFKLPLLCQAPRKCANVQS
jgi:hypothetical protein